MKQCSKCKKVKVADPKNFGLSKKGKNGLSSWCRNCKQVSDRIYSRQYRLDHPEWKKENNRKNKELVRLGVERWQKLNPDKHRAQYIFKRAKIKKEIIEKPCVVCGKEKVDGHHYDYSKPLDVIWLCHKHHKQLHAGIIKVKINKLI